MLSNNELVIRDGLEPNHLSWKTGRLTFDEAPLDSAFADIAHYFRRNLQVEAGLDVKITAEFEHQPLSEILDELEQVTGLAFDTTGGSLIVRK
jgi:ferric-dicitrate binding protein FerR (iron transport regulator)